MNAIVGTAGHIDHGKSVLVRALTGMDTDRLPQEKERGISIELGFAYMDGPDGERIGIVDVPGHERFVRQMLAGAQGFDMVLLVVSADDGVMPQTEEHFEIAHLLGITNGIFVITKCDLVDDGRVSEVSSELEVLAADTPLEGSPVLAVAANQGRGVEELRHAIFDRIRDRAGQSATGPFHMPVDRSFVLKGQGVVVTGTAACGSVAAGDNLEILPGGRPARVRQVHVHGRSVERARTGQRVALNLGGIDRADIARGYTVVSAGLEAESDRIDARVEVRPAARHALASHEPVRLYIGTDDVFGRILWLDGAQELEPGRTSYAQLRLRRPTVAFAGQRFVLRDESAQRTIGGGTVLLPRSPNRRSGDHVCSLELLASGKAGQRVEAALRLCPGLGMSRRALLLSARTDEAEIDSLLDKGVLVALPGPSDPVLVVAADSLAACQDALVDSVASFHRANPSAAGIETGRLRTALVGRERDLDATSLRLLIDRLLAEGRVLRKGARLALPDHRSALGGRDEELALRVLDAVVRGDSSPPTCKNLSVDLSVELRRLNEIVAVLAERGSLVRVSPDLVFASEVLQRIESELRGHLGEHGRVTAAGFRDLIATSRKYSIPLLDYFDAQGVTMRSGDVRKLRPARAGNS